MKTFILIFTFLLAVGNISTAQDFVNSKNTTTERAPNIMTETDSKVNNQITAITGRWFGQNAITSFFTKGFLNSTGSYTNMSLGSFGLFGAMEFSNTGTLYCIDLEENSPLQILDTAVGDLFTVGTITGLGSELVLSLSFNTVNNTMYLTTLGLGGDKLYTLDLITRAATFVANLGQNYFGIAINNAGQCYGISNSDNLYSIDLISGISTLIGPIGFDANFIQGLSFDRQTDILWYASFNKVNLRGELRTVNLVTGTTNLITPFNPTAQITGFAIPYYTAPPPPIEGSITVTRNQQVHFPDNGGNVNPAVDNIEITGIDGNVEIKKITLTLNQVIHSWVGDLRFWLTKDNNVDTSISRIGWTGTGFGISCNNFISTTLSDSAGLTNIQNIPTACDGGFTQASGSFNPKEPFSQFQNSGVNPNGTYTLRISDNAAGDTGSLRSWTLKIDYDFITGVNNNVTSIANDYSLSQNYPNPFNPSTKIAYSIPTNGLVTLKIYNILGKEVQTLVSEVKSAGSYEVSFNAASLSSGVYFYKLESGDFIDTKKMFLLK